MLKTTVNVPCYVVNLSVKNRGDYLIIDYGNLKKIMII